jgi:hypothetical protein
MSLLLVALSAACICSLQARLVSNDLLRAIGFMRPVARVEGHPSIRTQHKQIHVNNNMRDMRSVGLSQISRSQNCIQRLVTREVLWYVHSV